MSEQIKKSDISEKDVFGWIIEGAKLAEEQVRATNNEISKTAKIFKDSLGGKQLNNVAELKASEQAIISTNNLYKQKLKLEADLISIQARRTNAEVQLNKAVERSNREEAKKIQQQEKLTSAYSRVDGWLKKLKLEYRDLAIRTNSLSEAEQKRMDTLFVRITKLDTAFKAVDGSMGVHNRKVGDYTNQWNGLGNSINQLTREMPAFANSMQTGFMAISNNLPMFFDEIKKIKLQNKELIAQGQPVKSVFSQIGGAVLTVSSLLSIGVTLLTVYGSKVATLVTDLIKGNTTIRTFAENQKTLNEAIKEGTKNGIQEATQLDILYRTATNLNLSLEQRKKAVDKLQEQYPSYFANLKDEDILVGNARKQYEKLRDAIFDSARAKAIQKKLEERGIERFDTELELREAINETEKELNRLRKEGNDLVIKGSRAERTQDIVVTNEELIKAQERRLKIEKKNLKDFTESAKKEDELLLKAQFEYYKKSEDLESDRIKVKEAKGVHSKKEKEKDLRNEIRFRIDEEKLYRESLEELELLQKEFDAKAKKDKEQKDAETREMDENLSAWRIRMWEWQAQQMKNAEDKKIEDQKKAQKELLELAQQYFDILTDYAIKKSNQRIEQIDKEIQASQKQYDLLVELAKNGNIQAQQSLAQQQKMIIESEKKKKEELQKQEIIKLGGTAIDVFSNKVANNDPQPLLSTIKDITLLKAFISSLASFDVGSERTFADSGSGIDGKGGRMAILHPDEKVFKKEHSKKIGFDISNDEVADVISLYKQGTLVPINKVGAFAGTSYDLKPLLKEVQELKDVIKNQPIPNLEVGRITRDLYEFGQKTVKGNTTTIDTYQIRKRG